MTLDAETLREIRAAAVVKGIECRQQDILTLDGTSAAWMELSRSAGIVLTLCFFEGFDEKKESLQELTEGDSIPEML